MERGVISSSLERGDGGEIDFHPTCLSFLNHCLVTLDKLASHGLAIPTSGSTDVVNTLEDDDLLHAELSEDVSVETVFGQCAESSRYNHTIVSDAEIKHTLVGYLMFQLQHLRHHVWPTVLGIVGGAFAIGDGVAHDGNAAEVGPQRINVDATDVVPMVLPESLLEVGVGVGHAFHNV